MTFKAAKEVQLRSVTREETRHYFVSGPDGDYNIDVDVKTETNLEGPVKTTKSAWDSMRITAGPLAGRLEASMYVSEELKRDQIEKE